jgi:AMMECR1 domain-containing protein
MGWLGDLPADTQIKLARAAIVAVVTGKGAPTAPENGHTSKAVFVTIEVDGTIRGCRGSLSARCRTLEAEIAEAGRSAAANDPRYKPLRKEELDKFKVTVTIVDRLEPVSSVAGIGQDVGIVLKSGEKTGVVLPWEGKDPEVRLEWAYRKAGVDRSASVKLYRLIADRVRG